MLLFDKNALFKKKCIIYIWNSTRKFFLFFIRKALLYGKYAKLYYISTISSFSNINLALNDVKKGCEDIADFCLDILAVRNNNPLISTISNTERQLQCQFIIRLCSNSCSFYNIYNSIYIFNIGEYTIFRDYNTSNRVFYISP